jgi:hypothetical protein
LFIGSTYILFFSSLTHKIPSPHKVNFGFLSLYLDSDNNALGDASDNTMCVEGSLVVDLDYYPFFFGRRNGSKEEGCGERPGRSDRGGADGVRSYAELRRAKRQIAGNCSK